MSNSRRQLNYQRIVVDVDVLAADLLCGGLPRECIDIIRSHSWLELVVTEQLLEETQTVISRLTESSLADAWSRKMDDWDQVHIVDQPPDDYPALAAAYQGQVPHLVSMNERLQSIQAGMELQSRLTVSIRSPAAFVQVYDPGAIYGLIYEDEYEGPDQDARF